MIPVAGNSGFDLEAWEQPTRTYQLHKEKEVLGGYCDGLAAMEQAVYKCLHTERYEYLIYSWNYGVELRDLFGKPIPFVYSELKRRITEALLQDERVLEVDDFAFSRKKGEVLATFAVSTSVGEIRSALSIKLD